MKVKLDGDAVKQYRRLNEPMLGRITSAIDGLKKDPPDGDIKMLKGNSGFRLRVGGYRILFRDMDNIRFVYRIAPRGGAYRREK